VEPGDILPIGNTEANGWKTAKVRFTELVLIKTYLLRLVEMENH
jgi:hypothetical protein